MGSNNFITTTIPNTTTNYTFLYQDHTIPQIQADKIIKSNYSLTLSPDFLMIGSNTIISEFYNSLKNQAPLITKVEILNYNKVIRFTFENNKIIKTICKDSDTFDFEFAFYLAYAKYFWNDYLTPAGIENKAIELMNIKFFNKLVEKGIKLYNKQKKKQEQEAKEKMLKKIKQNNKKLKKKGYNK